MSQDDTDLPPFVGRRKEIEELVDEENRDDESLERKSHGSQEGEEEDDPLQKEQIFPSVNRIDSH